MERTEAGDSVSRRDEETCKRDNKVFSARGEKDIGIASSSSSAVNSVVTMVGCKVAVAADVVALL